MSSEEILTCRNLTVGYEDCRLCEDINFTVKSGDYICVVGHSGIGKSALVSTLMGIEKPICGDILFANGLGYRNLGCLPQEQNMRGASVVIDMVLSGCLCNMKKWFVGKAERARAAESLERLGISELSKRRFGDLSGGQKQKVLLARALCAASKLLILDEPVQGLDVRSKDEMYSEIDRINRDDGIAVIMVDNSAASEHAKQVLHLSDRQLFFGEREEYLMSVPGQFYSAGRII